MKLAALLLALAACSPKAPHASVVNASVVNASAPPPVATTAPAGRLLWVRTYHEHSYRTDMSKPAPTPRWMLTDLARMQSEDLGDEPLHGPATVNGTADGIFLAVPTQTVRVRNAGSTPNIDTIETRPPGGVRWFDAIAPDGSSVAYVARGALCVDDRGDSGCRAPIKLPFAAAWNQRIAYTSGDRLVVTEPAPGATGAADATAPGLGLHVRLAVVDRAAQTATELAVDAIGYAVYVSPDGRVAWNEVANGKLLVAVASLDDLAAKQTYELGPAVASSQAPCRWGADRLVCAEGKRGNLVSIDTAHGSVTTLARTGVYAWRFEVSRDGRWVAYSTGDGAAAAFTWWLSPTDRADAAQRIPLEDLDYPIAFL